MIIKSKLKICSILLYEGFINSFDVSEVLGSVESKPFEK